VCILGEINRTTPPSPFCKSASSALYFFFEERPKKKIWHGVVCQRALKAHTGQNSSVKTRSKIFRIRFERTGFGATGPDEEKDSFCGPHARAGGTGGRENGGGQPLPPRLSGFAVKPSNEELRQNDKTTGVRNAGHFP